MDNDKFKRLETQDNFVTEKVDVIKNNMLGGYDEESKYVIAPQIVNELIDLKKYRKSTLNNSLFCAGNLLGYGEITFEIVSTNPIDNDPLYAKAELYVLESVDKVNGYLQNVIKTKIAEFICQTQELLEKTYIKFNLINSEDDAEKENKSLDNIEIEDSYILAKKAYMLLVEKLTDEKLLDAYGKYFTARLSLLSKMDNEFSNAVLNSFNSKYNLIENIFLKDKNYKSLNELLDSCFEEISGTKEIYIDQENDFNSKIAPALSIFTDNVNTLNNKVEQKAMSMLEKSDRDKVNEMNENVESNEVPASNTDTDSNVGSEKEIPVVDTKEVENHQEIKHDEIENPVLLDEEKGEEEKETEEETESKQEDQPVNNFQTQEENHEEINKENVIQQTNPQKESDVEEEIRKNESILEEIIAAQKMAEFTKRYNQNVETDIEPEQKFDESLNLETKTETKIEEQKPNDPVSMMEYLKNLSKYKVDSANKSQIEETENITDNVTYQSETHIEEPKNVDLVENFEQIQSNDVKESSDEVISEETNSSDLYDFLSKKSSDDTFTRFNNEFDVNSYKTNEEPNKEQFFQNFSSNNTIEEKIENVIMQESKDSTDKFSTNQSGSDLGSIGDAVENLFEIHKQKKLNEIDNYVDNNLFKEDEGRPM